MAEAKESLCADGFYPEYDHEMNNRVWSTLSSYSYILVQVLIPHNNERALTRSPAPKPLFSSTRSVFKMVPTFFEIFTILQDEEKAILYLLEKNIVPALNTCPALKELNTLFSISKLQINEVLSLCYFWLTESKHKQLCLITGHSPSTITSIMRYLRKMAGKIDESKLGKNKYNRGHLVSGPWVLGGVEKTREIKAFQVEVPDRTAETLINIIRRYVLPGSRLSSYYEHLTANHSQSFINRANGACTNTIEGTWSALKMKISPRNRKNSFNEDGELEENTSDQFLGEFLWRRKNSGNLWEGLLKCIREVEFI
ncbi:hypothetical protein RF11_04355 [Thelohanellus kitauei]|uniref:ISXO2-like transposase domain-containing protein n=1 Tax=Thelohanellus kitauei TaxID=669202 RepID=A0A0C2N882_THEKT|nr:hypothetical protein RF11_04355 [Thelohanellus kitauei]